MKPSAVLLIDLENFYHSRRDYFRDANIPVGDQPEPAEDLAMLVRVAERMAELPLAVRRAYANFNSLPGAARDLMHRGIEPIQVFCLAETSNKNAADMKLAMDAVALAGSGAPFEHFVLVTGDSDFIPVILELKRRGHGVSVVAVTGSTSPLIRRFADKFKRFEDLTVKPAVPQRNRLAPAPAPSAVTATAVGPAPVAEPAQAPVPAGPDELPRLAAALKRVLARVRPVRINQIHRELSKELGYSFDPAVFGCSSTGAFVRRNATALGVVVRGAQNDQEIDLPTIAHPSTNGSHTTKPAAPRAAASAPVSGRPPEPHTAAHYKELLGKGRANENIVSVVPWNSLVAVCDATVPVLTPPTGGPTPSLELLSKLKAAGAPDDARLIVSALRCALPVPATPGVYSLPPDETGAQIRARLLKYIVFVLRTRLTDSGTSGPVRSDVLAEMFEPGPALDQAHQEIAAALAEPVTEPEVAAAAPARTSARVEAVHTPAGYRDLFKSGGQEGSQEPEHQSINPPPWTSFERVCADAFAALSPSAGGGELTLDQFHERLYAAEKDMPVPNYRSHARRAVTVLKLSNAVLEENSRLTLHPQVAEPNDIRWAALGVMLTILTLRLRERDVPGPVRAEVFAAAIAAGPLTDELVPQITQAIEGIERATEAEVETEAATEASEVTPSATEPTQPEVPVEIVTEFVGELVPVIQPEFPEPRPTASECAIAQDPVASAPAPVSGSPPSSLEVAPDRADPYSFDGTLPEFDPPADSRSEPELELARGNATDAVVTPSSDVVDVAALTRDAVAHPTEPAVAVVPVGELMVSAEIDDVTVNLALEPETPGTEQLTTGAWHEVTTSVPVDESRNGEAAQGEFGSNPNEPLASVAQAPAAEPVPALVIERPTTFTSDATAALNRSGHPADIGDGAAPPDVAAEEVAPAELPAQEPLALDDDYPLAIPIADWLPDDEPFFGEPLPDVEPAPAGGSFSSRTASPPSGSAETFDAVAKITPIPPEFRQPPFPPLPPESA